MKFKIAATALFCILSMVAVSQIHVKQDLDNYMQHSRTAKYTNMPDKRMYSKENAPELLQQVSKYYSDTLANIRSKAYYFTYKAGLNTTKDNRIVAVNMLSKALKEPDSGNVGDIISWLTEFSADDFSKQAKDTLLNSMKHGRYHKSKIIKLLAFVGLTDQIPYLRKQLNTGNYTQTEIKWAAHLALARMGEENDINYCLNKVKQQGVNDDVIYELIPDLIYTKQRQTIDYVVELLHNEEENCTSGNPEYGGSIMCAYRIMELLAPVIKDFPLKTDSDDELLVDDYEEALTDLRKWFIVHANDYQINTDRY